MDGGNKFIILLVVIALYVFKYVWDKIREKLPVTLRKLICFVTYSVAAYVYIFCYDDFFVKMLGLLFVPFATCLIMFGRTKKWDGFQDFLKNFYDDDGLFLMSVIVITFWLMFMI